MAAPKNATGKIIIPYTSAARLHKLQAYVRNIQVSGGSFNINTRATDSNDLLWSDAAQALAATLSYLLPTTATVGAAELHQKSGSNWNLIATATVTFTHLAGSVVPGSQLTATYRDLQFYQVKFVAMEGAFAPCFTSRTVASFGGAVTNALKQLTSAFTETNAPYNWMVGIAGQFLNPNGTFIKGTATFNRKMRRRAGLA